MIHQNSWKCFISISSLSRLPYIIITKTNWQESENLYRSHWFL